MQPDPTLVVLREYGWAAVLLYFFVREIWPSVRDRLIPSYVAERKRKQEEEINERKHKAEEDNAYRCRLEDLEKRQVAAFEKVGDAVQQMSVAMVLTNERLAQMIASQAEHHRAMVEGFERSRPVIVPKPQ